jgi:DNA polymerase-4
LYRRAADALERILRPFVPIIEPHTLGHAYGDLSGTYKLFGPATDIAARIRRDIWGRLGLPVTVGLAVNKAVSEVAAHVLKPEPVVDVRPGDEPTFLAPYPLAALPGALPAIREQLSRYNVRHIGTLAALTRVQVEGVLGRRGAELHARANGIDPRPVVPPVRRATLRAQSMLRVETNDRDLLHTELRRLAEQLGRELRGRRVTADRLELVARYADHRDAAGATALQPATDLDADLTTAARTLADRLLTRRIALTALGVVVALGAGSDVQLSLFDPPTPTLRRHALNTALDRVRRRHGTSSIRYAR